MGIFYLTLVSTYFVSLFGRYFGKIVKFRMIEPNKLSFLIVTCIFILVGGLRNNIGDTYYYVHSYELAANGLTQIGYERGFDLLIRLLVKISKDPQFFIFILAFITNLFILKAIKRDSSYFELSCFLYITSGYYLVTMNGLRQTLVAALFFYFGIKFIKQKRVISYFILVFILSFLHDSASFLYIIYFLGRERAWTRRIIVMTSVAVLVALFFETFSQLIAALSGKYEDYFVEFEEGGAHPLRVVVAALPVIMAYLNKKRLEMMWPQNNIFINLSVLNLIFMILALNNWIFARFNLYLETANFILLPYIIKNSLRGDKKNFIYAMCIICYFIYYYYDQAIMMRIVYRSTILRIY